MLSYNYIDAHKQLHNYFILFIIALWQLYAKGLQATSACSLIAIYTYVQFI